ncbi:DUF2254 family protein [Blastococcus sp. PRF04-17]|uniref:DUF2254 family protein n=1 Tax=Blastococcus sp. PRF04-17 TaxID=2933797 RepID=UPI0035300D23
MAANSAEGSRQPLWVWPTTSGVVAGVAAWALGTVKPRGGFLAGLWPSDTSAAGTLLQLVATGAITITTLTFSITIVALQLASQQFSPRLLREFARDRTTKQVLAVLSATFVVGLVGLRSVNGEEPVPTLLCLLAAALGLASFGAVLGFITHMVKLLRVDTMMTRVHEDTDRAISQFYPAYGSDVRSGDDLRLDRSEGRTVSARKSGFVQMIDVDRAVAARSGTTARSASRSAPATTSHGGHPSRRSGDRRAGRPTAISTRPCTRPSS